MIHLLAAFLCAWRLTDLILRDEIFATPRRWASRLRFNPLNCIVCVSVWAGIVAYALFRVFPEANYPLAFSQGVLIVNLALQWNQFHAWLKDTVSKKVVLRPATNGNSNMELHGGVTAEQAYNVMRQFLSEPKKEEAVHGV